MKTCKDCHIVLEDSVRYCPNCGNAVASVAPVSSSGSNRMIWVWSAVGAILLLAVLFIMLAVRPGKKAQPRTERLQTGTARVQPQSEQPGYAPSTTGNSPYPRSSQRRTTSQPSTAGSPAQSGGVRTQGEDAIKERTAEDNSVKQTGAAVDDVIADPRSGGVTITFSLPPGPSMTKIAIVNAATAVAKAAFAAHTGVDYITIRCVTASGATGSGEIVFLADTTREAMESANPQQSPFTNAWWNSHLQ